MNWRSWSLAMLCVVGVSGCATPPPPAPLHDQMADLMKSGAKLSVNFRAGDPRVVRDNPTCQSAPCTTTGRGVYIGDGLILTAAHVVQQIQPGDTMSVEIREYTGSAQLVWANKKWDRGQGDLALLRLGSALLDVMSQQGTLSPMPVCQDPPSGNLDAVILGFNVMIPTTLTSTTPSGEFNVLSDGEPGFSGSGIIDLQHKCLAGVLSAQNGLKDVDGPRDNAASWGMRKSIFTPVDASIIAVAREAAGSRSTK